MFIQAAVYFLYKTLTDTTLLGNPFCRVPAGQLEVPVAAGKRKRQKPKLTVEHLKVSMQEEFPLFALLFEHMAVATNLQYMQERHGIAEVFHTFPKKFKQDFKGQGHEVGHQTCPRCIGTTKLNDLSSRNVLISGR